MRVRRGAMTGHAIAREAIPPARGGAATVGQPLVWSARRRVDVQRSIKQGTISAL